jgi:hypothetical protein
MSQGQPPPDDEGINWLPFMVVFVVATIGFLIWLAFTWPPKR